MANAATVAAFKSLCRVSVRISSVLLVVLAYT